MDCIGFATSDEAWCRAQLGLNSGGLGLRSLSLHSSSAYIASVCSSGVVDSEGIHLTNALDHFYSHVSPIEKLSVNSFISSHVSQKLLSSKVNDHCFQNLFDQSSPANKAIGCYQFQPLMPHPGYQLFLPHPKVYIVTQLNSR